MLPLSRKTRQVSGILLLSILTIEYGGFFLLGVLSGEYSMMSLTDFQKSMFRAGHAHAGVLVILSIVCQVLIDSSSLRGGLEWIARLGGPVSAILISGGFFFSSIGEGQLRPNAMIALIYIGIVSLGVSILILGVNLVRNRSE